MTYRIKVMHGSVMSGFDNDGARINILAGDYVAELISHTFDGRNEKALVVRQDDRRDGGDLKVRISDYYFLEEFPDINCPTKIQILP